MLEEKEIYLAPRSTSEKTILLALVGLGVLSALAFGGNTHWATPAMMVIGLLVSAITLRYLRHFPRRDKARKPHLALLSLALLTLVIGLVSCAFPLLQPLPIEESLWLQVVAQPLWLPASATPATTWAKATLTSTLLLTATLLLTPRRTPAVFILTLRTLGLCAAALAVIGLPLHFLGAKKILYLFASPHPDFFATFIHPAHWGAFALLWSLALWGTTLACKRLIPHASLLSGYGLLMPMGAWILALTTVLVAPAAQGLLALLGAVLGSRALAQAAQQAKATPSDPTASRVWRCLALLGLVGLLVFALRQPWNSPSALFVPPREDVALQLHERQALWRDGLEAFRERPLTGWGEGAFGVALTLHQEADLATQYYETGYSDLLRQLVETGLLGLCLWLIIPGLTLAYLWTQTRPRALSVWLLAACGSVLLLTPLDIPMQSPAVQYSFWLLFCGAIGWSLPARKGH